MYSEGKSMSLPTIIENAKCFHDEIKICTFCDGWLQNNKITYKKFCQYMCCLTVWHLSVHTDVRLKEFYCSYFKATVNIF